MRFPCLAACVVITALPLAACAQNDKLPPLKIGLDRTFRHSTALLVSAEDKFALKDSATNIVLERAQAGAIYRIVSNDEGITVARIDHKQDTTVASNLAGPIELVPEQSTTVKAARLNDPTPKLTVPWKRYHGALSVRFEDDATLRVVNIVDLEPYLYGVVPAEIGAKSPLEALKAQAVAARTYTLKNRGKLAREGMDLDDTTRCQSYLGIEGETPFVTAAIDATHGQVITYADALIDATYSTDSGGVTACDPTGAQPYLQAVPDCPAPGMPEYAADTPKHNWVCTFSGAQIDLLLGKDARTNVGKVKELTLDGVDASGRITTATIKGKDGKAKTVTGPQLRQILGYDQLRSTLVSMKVLQDGTYEFRGRGWGHGMGMSQVGAVAMASAPYKKNYKDILTHYYVGVQIVPLSTVKIDAPAQARAPKPLTKARPAAPRGS
ncbi:MAG: spoIID [Capsulimonas sp.]|jgi:stage II sporulation protein D|nr:spoIID [Capsulimonas sp.]